MSTSRYSVPLDDRLVGAVQAEALRVTTPPRNLIALFFAQAFPAWLGARVAADMARATGSSPSDAPSVDCEWEEASPAFDGPYTTVDEAGHGSA